MPILDPLFGLLLHRHVHRRRPGRRGLLRVLVVASLIQAAVTAVAIWVLARRGLSTRSRPSPRGTRDMG